MRSNRSSLVSPALLAAPARSAGPAVVALALALAVLALAACKFPYPEELPVDALDAAPVDAPDAAVDAAPVDAPPTGIGAFAAAGTLVAGRMDAAAVRAGDRLYVVGGVVCAGCAAVGADGGGVTASVEVATVSAAGPGAFALASPLGRARAGAAAFRVTRGGNDWLYVVGGYRDDGGVTFPLEVERAAIAGDGTIGAFADVGGIALDEGRAHARALVTADHVYLIGGWAGGSSYRATVTAATIDGNGDLGAFAPVSGVQLSSARARVTLVSDGALTLVAGGHAAGAPVTAVERATLSGGTLTGFTAVPTLATARAGAIGFALGGRAWLAGGGAPIAGTATDSIETAQLSPAGPFVLNSRRLDQARVLAAGALLPAHVCVVGGSATAQRAGILDSVACAPLQ